MRSGLLGLAAAFALAAVAPGPAVSHPARCSSYDHPGTVVAAPAPRDVQAQFGVLRRRRQAADRVALERLGPLGVSAITTRGIRRVDVSPDGTRLFIVPARHLLAHSLAPVRCAPKGDRPARAEQLRAARRTYPHEALCLVALSNGGRRASSCGQVPGDVATLATLGQLAFGAAPDGVPQVRLTYVSLPTQTLAVRGNTWRSGPTVAPPCGLEWMSADGVVLRTLVQCAGAEEGD